MRNALKILPVAALAVLLASAFAFHAMAQEHDHDHGKKDAKTNTEVTLQGEVLDLYCFMMHPADGQGPGHAKCAKNCIRKGLPIGFLADGEVYVLVGKDHESAADLVVDLAGTQARLKGRLMDHHGVKSIELHSIEPIASTK